ncbi:hypothetical protein MMC16_006195 [Acarospora aff. strigata]|nr:hypothetical protein [Acarospora aff. strigata]
MLIAVILLWLTSAVIAAPTTSPSDLTDRETRGPLAKRNPECSTYPLGPNLSRADCLEAARGIPVGQHIVPFRTGPTTERLPRVFAHGDCKISIQLFRRATVDLTSWDQLRQKTIGVIETCVQEEGTVRKGGYDVGGDLRRIMIRVHENRLAAPLPPLPNLGPPLISPLLTDRIALQPEK